MEMTVTDPDQIVIRTATDDDMDWMVRRHDEIYERELGWGPGFTKLVETIVTEFRTHHDPARERGWVAELDGEPVGMVLLVRLDDEVAKLRILLVEPEVRGRGIGSRLVAECLDFARRVGYSKVTLWTDSGLDPARHIYQREGFHLVHAEGVPAVELRDVVLEVSGADPNGTFVTYVFDLEDGTLRFDDFADPPHYIANFHTKWYPVMDGGEYTATVYDDGLSLGSIGFIVDATHGSGRGNGPPAP